MDWYRQATSHYLCQCLPISTSPYGVIRPQWVNMWRPEQNGRHVGNDIFKLIFKDENCKLQLKCQWSSYASMVPCHIVKSLHILWRWALIFLWVAETCQGTRIVAHRWRHASSWHYTFISQDEWRFLLAGGTTKPKDLPNPAPEWLSERSWMEVLTLSALPHFAEFPDDFPNHVAGFQKIFDSVDPHRWVTKYQGPAST